MSKRFVFDTNALISSILKKNSVSFLAYQKALQSGAIVYSSPAFHELCSRLLRSKFDKYVTVDERLSFIRSFIQINELVEPTLSIKACKDPDDDKFLELAVAANASCIISGDRFLRDLHPFQGIPILNAADFLQAFT